MQFKGWVQEATTTPTITKPPTATETTTMTTTTTSRSTIASEGLWEISGDKKDVELHGVHISGNIKNISNAKHSCELTVEAYDVNGAYMYNRKTTLEDVAPGETKAWSVIWGNGASLGINSYKIKITTFAN